MNTNETMLPSASTSGDADKSRRTSLGSLESQSSRELKESVQVVELEKSNLNLAIWVLRFAIFADTVNAQILGPNYALMVLENGHPDSFPTTQPFDFGAAYYLIPMSGDIGMVVSSLFFGYLSDKIGRKKCILTCMYFGAVGSVLKYFGRHSFWLFCAANFITGLFGGSLAVGMAYVSDVFPGDRERIDSEIGTLVAVSMVGRTGGGIVTILMQGLGLFEPLWVAVAVSVVAGILCQVWMHDANKAPVSTEMVDPEDNVTKVSCNLEDICKSNNAKTLWNILAGELADNLGSIGLVPLCVSPLMFNTFYAEFAQQDVDPVMSATAYKWIYVLVAVVVVPGAVAAPHLYKRIGPALSAAMANILTGAVTVALLWIAKANATTTTFAIFVTVLYLAFPLTVISQLSTGPMLDRIAPESQRGQIQGYNMAMMNFAGAVGPFLLGNLLDATSIDACLYTTAAISVVAALINFPLSRHPDMGPTKEEEDAPR